MGDLIDALLALPLLLRIHLRDALLQLVAGHGSLGPRGQNRLRDEQVAPRAFRVAVVRSADTLAWSGATTHRMPGPSAAVIKQAVFIGARSFPIIPVIGSFPLFHMFLDALISVFLSKRSRE